MVETSVNILKGLLLLLLLLSSFLCAAEGGVSISLSKQRQEVKGLLKRLNKPPVKTIQSPDGDIIDCVHVLNQPAFDNPLLKNHTIQTRPTSHPEGLHTIYPTRPSSILEGLYDDESSVASDSNPISQLWHQIGSCPEDTIPIRRVKEEDVLRASSIQRFGMKDNPWDKLSASAHEYATYRQQGGSYHGTKATINIWKPSVESPYEFSLSQLWVATGSGNKTNTIEAGWQVYNQIYKDNHTRLFIYWTGDGYNKTGCYNLKCPGFVQTNKKIVIGGTINVSIYNGNQAEMTLHVWKDAKTKNWWMKLNTDDVGYWPASLFVGLAKSSSRLTWGGEIVNRKTGGKHTSTDMGSGHFPAEMYGNSSYFRNIKIVDDKDVLMDAKPTINLTTHPKCYDIKKNTNTTWGTYFFYGGPGRNARCP